MKKKGSPGLGLLLLGLLACSTATAAAQDLNFTEMRGVPVMFKYGSAFRIVHPPPSQKRKPPPFRRRPPPSADVVYQHDPSLDELQIKCPQVNTATVNGTTEYVYPYDSALCETTYVPNAIVATGEEALAFVQEAQIVTGDVGVIDIVETEDGLKRRRILREGRTLLNDASSSPLSFAQFKIRNFTKITGGGAVEIFTGTQIELAAVVFLLDFSSCGDPKIWGPQPGVNVSSLNAAMLKSKQGSIRFANNMENYYMTCSYGKSLYPESNVYVVGPVPIPCRGAVFKNFTGRPPMPPRPPPRPPSAFANLLPASRRNDTVDDWWDISQFCTASEQQAWEREAEKWARLKAMNDPKLDRILKWSRRRRNIYALPSGVRCAWAGYADVTCTSPTCSAYVKTGLGGTGIHVFMHEALHNYGLEHAGFQRDEYGDESDVMGRFSGAGSGLLCPNAPNLFRIGWASPISPPGTPIQGWTNRINTYGNLTVSNFTTRNILGPFTIPAAGLRDDNFISVDLGSSFLGMPRNERFAFPVFFISYRVKQPSKPDGSAGFDSGLVEKFNRKILIHSYNGSQNERLFGFKPLLLDWGDTKGFTLQRTTWWRSAVFSYNATRKLGGRLAVKVLSNSDTQATVQLCRATMAVEAGIVACANGLDDDCDGVVDNC